MDIKELTDLLVTSSRNINQIKYIPWWEDDHENQIYWYHVLGEEFVKSAKECLAECGKEKLLSPVNRIGLTLFHFLVWHNFYDAVEKMLCDGRIEGEEVDKLDHRGHGLTPLMLACAYGNLAMVRLLLDHGADDSLCDTRGMNAYHFLVYFRIEGLEYSSTCMERSMEQRAEIARLLTCDINKKDAKGLTPLELLLSIERRSYTWPLAEIFLEKGAATDYVDEDGNTLLMMARINSHHTASLKLMEQRPDLINVANNKGVTPIMHAMNYHNQAMYIALLDHGADPVPDQEMELFSLGQITSNAFGDICTDGGDSLSLAMFLAKKMIRQMDPDDEDEMGEITYVLHNAMVADKEYHILDLCKEAGFDFTTLLHYHGGICLRDECLNVGYGIGAVRKLMELGIDMDSAVVQGRTPANILASKDKREDDSYYEEAIKLFSKESMERLDNSGTSAVHLAAENGHTGMLKIMIEKGVDINLTQDKPAEAGVTPLHLACSYGHTDVVKLLIAAGADDTMKNLNGETPAHFALMKKKYGEALKREQRAELLKELKHLDIPREDGQTPMMLLRCFDKELLTILLDRGADVNHVDIYGRTAMMLNLDKDMIKELLRAGADINAVDKEGNTVLHYALKNGAEGGARYLIRKGVDYNRPNNEGETPVQIAVEKGLEAVLELMTDIR